MQPQRKDIKTPPNLYIQYFSFKFLYLVVSANTIKTINQKRETMYSGKFSALFIKSWSSCDP